MLQRSSLVLLALSLTYCSSSTPEEAGEAGPGKLVESSKARITTPDASSQEVGQLARDNAAFAWDFYREAAKPGENLFLSPHSISVALAMTWAGARRETEAEMADAMHFTLGQERLHAAFNALDLELQKRAEAGSAEAPLPFRLNVTNALFGQVGFSLLDPFLDTLAQHYGAGMRLMDFVAETEQSRLAINQWVSERTEQRIEELIAPGIIDAATRLVLVNAIYFTASWAEPFDEAATRDAAFRRLDGSEVMVPTMHQTVQAVYGEGEGFQATELPYDGQQLAMLLLVPDEGKFAALEEALSERMVDEIRAGLSTHLVELAFPKFSFRSNVPAKAPLQALGMVAAFGPGQADFSGMTDTAPLFIQDVVHQAFVAVDERGTEAAAATAVIVGETSAPPPATLTVDRPFIFAIIDRTTGATLFLGRVLDPS
ncbi:MAG TPA: serpin family protein [Polyangiales bacterium]|nr:serpin family protein [Polyangiales bacterium]